jgi:hypothetical protein
MGAAYRCDGSATALCSRSYFLQTLWESTTPLTPRPSRPSHTPSSPSVNPSSPGPSHYPFTGAPLGPRFPYLRFRLSPIAERTIFKSGELKRPHGKQETVSEPSRVNARTHLLTVGGRESRGSPICSMSSPEGACRPPYSPVHVCAYWSHVLTFILHPLPDTIPRPSSPLSFRCFDRTLLLLAYFR